jgi:1-deoxy-D-xylulose-5-phosphate reductoisomerase
MDSIALPINLIILGSTGSIGTQTLDIARQHPDKIRITGLAAGSNADLLAKQVIEFDPDVVALADSAAADRLASMVSCRVLRGPEGVLEVAAHAPGDCVVTAMVGAAGLMPTIAAIEQGRRIALANKETMVVAGDLINMLTRKHAVDVLPVDSEHSAIYQSLVGEPRESIRKLILTASGGPFRNRPLDTFLNITPEEALAHPNWEMGPKITIDSATMMNKGLEVIEARWLFDIPPERIEVTIHPQSIIHSMVEFADGSSKAQLGPPDMKVPIQYALSAPDRWNSDFPVLDWSRAHELTFDQPDPARYPCLELAFEALRLGDGAGTVLNAANEVAVGLFLDRRITFGEIPRLIEGALHSIASHDATTLESRVQLDAEARRWVHDSVR